MAWALFEREEKRDSPLYVYLRPSERALLNELAEAYKMSVSTAGRGIILDYLALYKNYAGMQEEEQE